MIAPRMAGFRCCHSPPLLVTDTKSEPRNTPVTPFKIAGNLYYVGSVEQASYIISTNEGLILINTGPETSVPFLKPIIPDILVRINELIKEDPNISQDFKEAMK